MGQDLGGLVFFRLLVEYIRHYMHTFMTDSLERMVAFASTVGITLVTLWIIIQGYRIMTGQSREPLIGFVIQAGKVVVILSIVSSTALYNQWVTDQVTNVRDWMTYQLTGSNENVYTQVDKNLAATQIILTTINTINTPNTDAGTVDDKGKKQTEILYYMSAFGSGGPAIIAGMVSLLNEIMITLAIVFGPVFLLGLLFEQTKQLFWGWVKYMVGVSASMAVLAVVTSLVLKVTLGYAMTMMAALLIKVNLPGTSLSSGVSLSQTAMIQGGLGLIFSTLLITIPPMVMNFFGATLGGAVSGYGPFSGGPQPGKGMEGNVKKQDNVVKDPPSFTPDPSLQNTQSQFNQWANGAGTAQRMSEQNASIPKTASESVMGNARQSPSSIYGSSQTVNGQSSVAPQTQRNSYSGLPLNQSNKKQDNA